MLWLLPAGFGKSDPVPDNKWTDATYLCNGVITMPASSVHITDTDDKRPVFEQGGSLQQEDTVGGAIGEAVGEVLGCLWA